jgi:hypothetical protein
MFAEQRRKITQVDYVKLGGAWRIKLTFDRGEPRQTYAIERYASPEEAEQAFYDAIEKENARRGLDAVDYLRG